VPRYLPMAMIRTGRQGRERHCHADVWLEVVGVSETATQPEGWNLWR